MESDPPFYDTYKTLIDNYIKETQNDVVFVEECELPTIDLGRLNVGADREKCKSEIARASRDWGFFQVVNHGISKEIFEKIKFEQIRLFNQPFEDKFLNFSVGSYRWGTPTATCLDQFSWSEAFHIPLADISESTSLNNFRSTIDDFTIKVSDLAQRLAEILAEKVGGNSTFFQENCVTSNCYVRMNRYPPCPISPKVCGLMSHTDSDFLTILHQDQIGGLQLVKNGKWIAVRPNPDTLIINIGDLFQVWSNDVYKSVEHRVVTNAESERLSIAYFFCPSYDTEIQSCESNLVYRKFSFREYREQVQNDVKKLGYKIGLSRFLR